MKTVPDVKKIAAKLFFGSIPFGKVEGGKFSFSACTLMDIYTAVFGNFLQKQFHGLSFGHFRTAVARPNLAPRVSFYYIFPFCVLYIFPRDTLQKWTCN